MNQQRYEIILYEKENGRNPVAEFLKELAKHGKNDTELYQIKTYIDRLAMHGMSINMTYPETIRKESDEGIWALRPGGNRIFFFHYSGNRIVLLHAYKKQSNKAPKGEIKKAITEMKDYKRRNKDGGKHL
ncbi:MAG: type II toxin-antitoxin system RelE/ParE family toxin [Oscillospiraceae bacterium]|nr:type II toxin-antitoxin system RelE/ParE family toxin [Oscillospiraceae bacterium]